MLIRSFVCLLVLLALVVAAPARAQAMGHDPHPSTLAGLRLMVEHAHHHGHITNDGVAQSLLAKVNAAQAAVNRSQPAVAAAILQAFIREVEAQAGRHIVSDHADHLVMHTRGVSAVLITSR